MRKPRATFFLRHWTAHAGTNRHSRLLGAAAFLLCWAGAAAAAAGQGGDAEPAYCDPATFSRFEISLEKHERKRLKRLHAFRLGRVTVVGLGIGDSDSDAVRAFAQRFSRAGESDRYCTWYINDGNRQAMRTFNFRYVPNPTWLDERKGPAVYEKALGPAFAEDPMSFLSCAEERGYIAVGCDGMKHRGPTLFGMLLAYSGCTPEHATEIADGIWGRNGVPANRRLAIIRAAFERGRAQPAARARLAERLSR